MKRIISFVLILVLLFSLASLASCGDEQSKSDAPSDTAALNKPVSSSVTGKLDNADSSKNRSANVSSTLPSSTETPTDDYPYLDYSGNISIYECHSGDYTNPDTEWWKDFYSFYKTNYNGTVEVIDAVAWNEWELVFLKDFAAGQAPDLIYSYECAWPKIAVRDMVYSVDDMKKSGVMGFDHPALADKLDLVSLLHTYNGEKYAFANHRTEAEMIFINEDLFKKFGAKSPSEYYAEGNWSWQTFEQSASDLISKAGAKGDKDVIGYVGWDANMIVTAAGGQLVKINKDGSLKVTMDDAATLQGLKNVRAAYAELQIIKQVSDTSAEFQRGKTGMIASVPSQMHKRLFLTEDKYKIKFDWSMVPYPLDTSTNKSKIRSGRSHAWMVCSASSNAQGCINYIIAYNTFSKDNPRPYEYSCDRYYTAEQVKMIESCAESVNLPIYQGVGSLWTSQWDFWYAVQSKRIDLSEQINNYRPMFEQQVALENDFMN